MSRGWRVGFGTQAAPRDAEIIKPLVSAGGGVDRPPRARNHQAAAPVGALDWAAQSQPLGTRNHHQRAASRGAAWIRTPKAAPRDSEIINEAVITVAGLVRQPKAPLGTQKSSSEALSRIRGPKAAPRDSKSSTSWHHGWWRGLAPKRPLGTRKSSTSRCITGGVDSAAQAAPRDSKSSASCDHGGGAWIRDPKAAPRDSEIIKRSDDHHGWPDWIRRPNRPLGPQNHQRSSSAGSVDWRPKRPLGTRNHQRSCITGGAWIGAPKRP
ncbi:hypothetical protein H0E87_031536 [Populus deltoides]|uniref:Uncharacterized protein n=1 Tax=Populus deltoides TaxID=3696 RepID=A0A8T2WEN3_POPDE|nr:hypothetical protein H0E87_031536 [Populus deltoides]